MNKEETVHLNMPEKSHSMQNGAFIHGAAGVQHVKESPLVLQEVVIPIKQVPDSAVDDDSDGSSSTDLFRSFQQLHRSVGSFIDTNKTTLRKILIGCACLIAAVYLVSAVVVSLKHDCQHLGPLIGLTVVIATCITIWLVRRKLRVQMGRIVESIMGHLEGKPLKIIFVLIPVLAAIGVVVILALTIWQRPSNAIALLGLAFFVLFLWLFSAHPSQVIWRPIAGGLLLQFYLAVIILKWDLGYRAFQWLGSRVQIFLSFADYGSEFVFGKAYTEHIFAMKVLPVVIFFSCTINVLYYVGAMQLVISKIGWVMRKVLGTTAPESLCAAANIFVGLSEAPIVIRPFLSKMTKSELNAIMTGGFATIAGGVMAAYISFGVPPEHLLCASVMNAPCALAVAKLLYPETEESQVKKATDINLTEKRESNIIEAAAAGASASIKLVANIAANLIAFLAMLAFVNAMLSWFGSFLCYPELSFQIICSYVFMPVAYLMGVEWKDAGVIGELLGMKTFLNEFLAYKELSKFIDGRDGCVGPIISVRSEIIATYALCGFANLGSIGVQLGGLGPMAPERRSDLATTVLRSLLGGVVTCLITASVAGLLLVEVPADLCINMGMNMTLNSTIATNVTDSLVTGSAPNVTYLFNTTTAAAVL